MSFALRSHSLHHLLILLIIIRHSITSKFNIRFLIIICNSGIFHVNFLDLFQAFITWWWLPLFLVLALLIITVVYLVALEFPNKRVLRLIFSVVLSSGWLIPTHIYFITSSSSINFTNDRTPTIDTLINALLINYHYIHIVIIIIIIYHHYLLGGLLRGFLVV